MGYYKKWKENNNSPKGKKVLVDIQLFQKTVVQPQAYEPRPQGIVGMLKGTVSFVFFFRNLNETLLHCDPSTTTNLPVCIFANKPVNVEG